MSKKLDRFTNGAMQQHEFGKWVRYEDHEKEVRRLEEIIRKLTNKKKVEG